MLSKIYKQIIKEDRSLGLQKSLSEYLQNNLKINLKLFDFNLYGNHFECKLKNKYLIIDINENKDEVKLHLKKNNFILHYTLNFDYNNLL